METAKRKEVLCSWFAGVVDKLGYKFTPDAGMADFLLEQLVLLERKLGSPYCPCQAVTGCREADMKIVCPCIPYHRRHFDHMKQCWCGLYVHKDVTDPSALRQIPADEVPPA